MVVIISRNSHVNLSSLDNCCRKPFSSCGFSSSRRLVSMNSKKTRKMRIFCLNLGEGVVGKEFAFKPSFDECLKAMESIKIQRNRKKAGNFDRDKVDRDDRKVEEDDDDVSERLSVEKEGKGEKLRENERFSGEEMVSRVVGKDLISGNDSHRRKGMKGEVVREKCFMDMSKRREFGLALVKKEIGISRIANEKNSVRSGKLSRSSRGLSLRDDDNDKSGSDVKIPAFKFSDECSDVVDKPRVSRKEMEERIQTLAKWLNGADINMPEWMFSKTMRSAKIRFSDHSILRVIQILGKLGNWRRVLQVIEWLQRRERFKSNRLRYIYTTALDVLGKSRRPVEALNLFHAMLQQISSYPDLVAYHSIAVTLGQAGHIKELFDVIDTMRSPPKKKFKTAALGKWDPQLEPDLVVYNAVLNACVHRKQWEGAFWVLQQLRQQGQKPSPATYGLVMEVMLASGKYNLVHEFFRKAQKSSIPTALAYRVLVNTFWKEGKTDEAVEAVREMERRGIVGSAALYYDLARCLCSAGRSQEALTLIEKICKVANKPLVVTFTGLIQACIDSGNIQDGAYIFNQMKEFCSPNLVTCNTMLNAFLQHELFEEAKKLFHHMSEDSSRISSKSDYKSQVLPDTFTFNTMLDACAAEGRWDDFEHVYKRMLHHGYHFNAKRHLRMILEAARAGKEELLETTWELLCQADRTLPTPLIKERFCMKLRKGDYVSALSFIRDIGDNELPAFSKSMWLNLLKENSHRVQKDTIVRLMEDAGKFISRSESPNPVLNNLFVSCNDFLRNHIQMLQ